MPNNAEELQKKFDRIILIGGILDDHRHDEIYGNIVSFLPHSADIFQKNMLNGLYANGIANLEIVNSQFIGSYPRYNREKRVPDYEGYYSEQARYPLHDIGFLNLPVIGEQSRARGIISFLKKNCAAEERILFLIYSLLPHHAKVVQFLKRYYPRSETAMVITDLPQFMTLTQRDPISLSGLYHSFMNWKHQALLQDCIEKLDHYILLSTYMDEVIPADRRDRILHLEGLLNTSRIDAVRAKAKKSGPPRITYTGALEENLGIMDLIEAFELLEGNAELYLAGDGTCRPAVEEKVRNNSKIHYLGSLPSEQAVQLQLESDVLVCPTRTNGGFSKYAFPAKLLEYLFTGNQVVCTRLDCIPDDYRDYLIYADGEGPAGLRTAIGQALERKNQGAEEQIRWIREHKSDVKQMERLLHFVSA